MNINTIGEILRFYREKYSLKQSDVCADKAIEVISHSRSIDYDEKN